MTIPAMKCGMPYNRMMAQIIIKLTFKVLFRINPPYAVKAISFNDMLMKSDPKPVL